MKKVVFKLEFYEEKVKQKAMQRVSGLSGVESVSIDMKEKKLTVTGDIDPVKMAASLRKICHTDIITVGPHPPPKEPEKKKDEPKKDEPKKEEPKKMSLGAPPPPQLKLGGGGGGGGGGGDEKKKDVKALVPVSIRPVAAAPAPAPVSLHQGQLVKAFPSEPYHHLQYPPPPAMQQYYGYNQYPPPLPAAPAAYYARSHVEEDPNSCVIC